jgi:hypothetical protein
MTMRLMRLFHLKQKFCDIIFRMLFHAHSIVFPVRYSKDISSGFFVSSLNVKDDFHLKYFEIKLARIGLFSII